MADKPRAREKHVTGQGAGVHKRGEGLGTGPVGSGSSVNPSASGSGRSSAAPSRGMNKYAIIAVILLLLFGGGGGIGSLLGGGSEDASYTETPAVTTTTQSGTSSAGTSTAGATLGALPSLTNYSSLLGQISGGTTSSGWSDTANTGKLDRTVDARARDKYTTILGNGQDVINILVYMCGTDLENRSGMATRDLTEMTKATIGSNVRLIVYTGGCQGWKNSVISSSVNQIYQVTGGGLKCLEKDMGSKPMTDPATLVEFLNYAKKNYSDANRNMLIFWDHGGGSLTGYGYDQKYPNSGAMNLAGINNALKSADMKFDLVGFDACLMATVETDLMLANYADYVVASEETEPGVGWYYTNWLTNLSADPSMATIDIGKNIADDFVDECARSCAGQKTTLSVVDLAELSRTLGDDFVAFSKSTTDLIKEERYKVVSDARSNAREFAQSSRIDQIDLVQFAKNMGTEEGKALADTLLGAVKYNRTSSNMTNAYGISVYFPYQKVGKVDSAITTYNAIDLPDEYSACIREFASLEVAGQVSGSASGYGSPLGMLMGGFSSAGASSQSGDQIASLLGAFMGGNSSTLSGLSALGSAFLSDRALTDEQMASYVSAHQLEASALTWTRLEDGSYAIALPEEQWELVHKVDLNLFYDDGEGYIDLGLDNLYTFTEEGYLVADTDDTWLSLDDQPVAYYHMDTVETEDGYTITGYVPAFLNGERVKLILLFDDEHPYGYVAGAQPVYAEDETEAVARGLTQIEEGDTLDFICDYYAYDGTYEDSYYLGEQMTVDGELTVSNTRVGSDLRALYRFEDIYGQLYWSDVVPR
ncbi:MAG: peptidase C11 [Lachnospiraceae bacterium]|nr:peptidase C11 [Lachnospiraceae bacterium]